MFYLILPIIITYHVFSWLYRKFKPISFKNKIVWITGASGGIGEVLAYRFASLGATLIISARREEELERVRKRCANPDKVTVLPLDLSNTDVATRKAAEFLERKGIKVDILVNNSGVGMRAFFLEMSHESEKEMMNVNYFAPIQLARLVLPKMLSEKSGQIVNINSIAGKLSSALRTSYSGSKSALGGFFDSVRAEYSDQGISITSIHPGAVNTDITVNSFGPKGEKFNKRDPFITKGLSVDAFSDKAMKAIYYKDNETIITKEYYLLPLIMLRNLFPDLVFFLVSKHKKKMLQQLAASK